MLFVFSQQEVLPVTRLILEVARLNQVLVVCLNRVHIKIPRLEATLNQDIHPHNPAIHRNNKDTHSKAATLRRNLVTRPLAATLLGSRDILRLNRVPIQEQLRVTVLLRVPATRRRAERAILNKVHKAIRLSSSALRTLLILLLHLQVTEPHPEDTPQRRNA